MRIIFTGGSGKAGRHILPYLASKGHTILNLDRVKFPTDDPKIYTLVTELTDSGQVFNALTSLLHMSEFELPWGGVPPVDAVIHFAAVRLCHISSCEGGDGCGAACRVVQDLPDTIFGGRGNADSDRSPATCSSPTTRPSASTPSQRTT